MSSKTLPPSCKFGPKTQSHKMKGVIIGLLKTTFQLVSIGLNWSQLVQRALMETMQSLTSTQQILHAQRWQGSQSLVICLHNLTNPNQDKNVCSQSLCTIEILLVFYPHQQQQKGCVHGILLIFFSCPQSEMDEKTNPPVMNILHPYIC